MKTDSIVVAVTLSGRSMPNLSSAVMASDSVSSLSRRDLTFAAASVVAAFCASVSQEETSAPIRAAISSCHDVSSVQETASHAVSPSSR